MTQQQIIDAGIDYTMANCPICMSGAAFADKVRQFNRNPSFETGGKWVKEELIKEACEWLYNNLFQVCHGIDEISVMSIENIGLIEFVENFKKAIDK